MSAVRRFASRGLCYHDARYTEMRVSLFIVAASISIGAGACYYPAKTSPPLATQTREIIQRPYDLTWDAVHRVVNKNEFKILGDDPAQGIVEAEAHAFTLGDADCGQMKSVGSRFDVEPDPAGSAVYNFKVEPAGPESTNLTVNATFSTPLRVPLHPVTDFQCVSRGTQETRLLREIDVAAHSEQRPTRQSENLRPFTAGHPTLLGPDILKRPTPSNN
jgi:hypothetical protein